MLCSRRKGALASILAEVSGQGSCAGVRGGLIQDRPLCNGQSTPAGAGGPGPPAAPSCAGQQTGERVGIDFIVRGYWGNQGTGLSFSRHFHPKSLAEFKG